MERLTIRGRKVSVSPRLLPGIVLGVCLVMGIGCSRAPEESPKGPIRIGGSMALTGRLADPGNYIHQGYLLWAKHVNAKGGLLGRPVELLIYDDKSDPQTSVYLYQQLINQDKVDLVLGPYSSPIAIVASTVTEKLRYPMIPLAASEEIWKQGYRYVFGMAPPATHYLDGALAIAKQQGLKRIALVNENTVFAHSVALGVIEAAREMGLQIVFHEEYRKGKKDFQWLLREIKALKPEVLLTGSLPEEAKLITRQLKQVNFMPKLYAVATAARLDEFGAVLGRDAEYVLGFSEWEPRPSLGLPGMQPFIEDFQKEFGRPPSSPAAGYAAGQVLEAAVTKVGSLDREKIRDALASLDMVTVYGRYKVDPDGLQLGCAVFLIQWQKGKREIVWPEAYATAKLVYPIPPWHARKGR